MNDDDLDKVQPQREDGEPLTRNQQKELKANVRQFLASANKPAAIVTLIMEKFVLSKTIAERYVAIGRRELEKAGGGLFKVQVQNLTEQRMRDIVADKKSSNRDVIAATRILDDIFDLKRKPEEDQDSIQRVVEREAERMKGMTDRQLADYILLLGSNTLDEEFANMVEAERRGKTYLPERRGEVDPRTLRPRKGTRRKYKTDDRPQ